MTVVAEARVVGDWLLEERIGGGGQAVVYRARHIGPGWRGRGQGLPPLGVGRPGVPHPLPPRVRGAVGPAPRQHRPDPRPRGGWRSRLPGHGAGPGRHARAAAGGRPAAPGRGPGAAGGDRRRAWTRPTAPVSCTATSRRATSCSTPTGPWLADFGIARRIDTTTITGRRPAGGHGRVPRARGDRGRARDGRRPTATGWPPSRSRPSPGARPSRRRRSPACCTRTSTARRRRCRACAPGCRAPSTPRWPARWPRIPPSGPRTAAEVIDGLDRALRGDAAEPTRVMVRPRRRRRRLRTGAVALGVVGLARRRRGHARRHRRPVGRPRARVRAGRGGAGPAAPHRAGARRRGERAGAGAVGPPRHRRRAPARPPRGWAT